MRNYFVYAVLRYDCSINMTTNDSMSLPLPAYAGGTKAITFTPIVGAPRREYAEMYIPGEEPLEDGELRVTVLGSGNPWVTRGQASGSPGAATA
jgi:ribonuclease Z